MAGITRGIFILCHEFKTGAKFLKSFFSTLHFRHFGETDFKNILRPEELISQFSD